MRLTSHQHINFRQNGHTRRALFAAIGALALTAPAFATSPLYFDTTTAAGLLGGTAIWDAATTKDWSTTTAGVANGNQVWSAGETVGVNDFNVASFNGTTAATANVSGIVDLGGINFVSNFANTIGGSGAVGSYALNIGSNNIVISNGVNQKQIIAAPITGSGNITFNETLNGTGGPLDLAGDLTGFTGGITVNNMEPGIGAANTTSLQLDQPLGNPNAIINMGAWTVLTNNNQVINNTVATPLAYTIANPIILNYNSVAPTTVAGVITNVVVSIGASNGLTNAGVLGNATFASGTEKIVTFSGAISSGAGVTTDVTIGGPRGQVVLSNPNNTWTGATTDVQANTNGLFQMGVDNALPTGTLLGFGAVGTAAVGPMDLNGHNLTIGGLRTLTTITANNSTGGVDNGNIYNTSLTSGSGGAPVTITVTGAFNTTYAGDIGDTNLNVNPFNDMAPFTTGTAAASNAHQVVTTNTNISLVVNGPGTLTLAPVANQSNGNEYSGPTTVNGGGLSFGRITPYTSGSNPTSTSLYTLTGGGAVNVMSGATLASVPTTFGSSPTYAGGASGLITLNTGSTLSIGGAAATGVFSTNSMAINAGVNLNFDFGSNSSIFDSLFVGSLTLDPSGTSTVNLGLASGVTFVSPGTYTLINAGTFNVGAGLTLNSSAMPSGETFTPQFAGNTYQVIVTAPAVQWDPNGNGAALLLGSPSQKPLEGAGTWTNGSSTFVNYASTPVSEYTWSNSDAKDVIIGNDNTQAGDIITLGSDITTGKITFGPIFPLYNYNITAGGPYSLTINGGINVSNTAATSTTPSAEIDAPIILGADQTWSVDPGQFLDIKGTVTGNFNLTKTGTGILDIESAGGSIASLAVNGGTVLLGAPDSIGATAPISLNGGGVEFSVDGTPANPISIGALGGSLGATNQPGGGAPYNVTFSADITGGNPLTAIGTGNTVFNGSITASTFTVSTSTSVAGGIVTLNGNNTIGAISVNTGGTLNLNGSNTINTISVTNGTLAAASQASLGGPATPISLAPATTTTTVTLSLPGFSTLGNPINIGTNGSANMTISDTVPLTLAGVISGNGNIQLVGPDFTLSNANTNGNSVDFDTAGQIVHATNAASFGTATIAVNANSTLDAQVDVSANAMRSSTIATTLHKTGPGTLTINAAASVNSIAGSALVIDQGAVRFNNALSLGGTAVALLDITVNSGASLFAHFGTGTHSGGNITLNSGTFARDDGFTGETGFSSTSATSGLITVNGNSTILDNDTNTTNTDEIFGITNPVLVTSGSTLTAEMDTATGYPGNHAIDFRGPTNVATGLDSYITFKIQSGATVKQVGAGELRFGRISSQGIAIIGQGTPGAESLLQLSTDTFMTDKIAANQIPTEFVVNGSGSAGLRIEAAMNATYPDPATAPPQNPIGTTGLFGINTTSSFAGNGNGFTVLSPNRAAALSSSYNDATTTYTPSGTLTLAANDPAGATGAIGVGPAAAAPLTLALDNTSSSGNLVYQLDGQAAGTGPNLLNFSNGITLQRSFSAAGTVLGQLKSNSHIASLSLLNSTTFDLVDHALAVEDATNTSSYLSAHTLFSSSVNNDPNHISTIAIILGSQLGGATSFDNISGITPSTTLYAPAYFGDINLDGRINADDYALMDRSVAKSLPANWIDGDFNNDGFVNSADYMLMDRSFALTNGNSLSPSFLAQREAQFGDAYVQSLVSSIPEPTTLSLLALATPLLARRRRTR
ncbi:MAG TPA: dockerin type I domain-containing protein [Tepidisphaeraceae bacterium]|jgi:hypothetical protein|nr:dockerin type I domain-containing protein [Tepidisphaeraceae bacterium]